MENTSGVSHPQAEYKILLVEDDKLDQKAFERLVKDDEMKSSYQIKAQLHAGREELSLALPIAKKLVEMHGGWIWAEGRDGRGNSFCFTLPKPKIGVENAKLEASIVG